MIEQRFTAVNTDPESENAMHADEFAIQYGFRGGLVPGVEVFGYMAQTFERETGREWRTNGWAEVRLLRPFYDGEAVIVTVETVSDGWFLSANGEDGAARATMRAGLKNLTAVPVMPDVASLPDARPAASEESLEPGTVLGSLHHDLRDASPREMLELANRVLMRNVVLEPWIHTASKLQWFREPTAGQTIEVRAAVEDLFDRKGRSMVHYLVAYLHEGEPLLNVDHTAVWRMRKP